MDKDTQNLVRPSLSTSETCLRLQYFILTICLQVRWCRRTNYYFSMEKIKYCTLIEFVSMEGLNTKQICEQLLEM